MTDTKTNLRVRIRSGGKLLGCFLTWPVGGAVELLGLADFDFVVVDVEHGFHDIESVENLVRAADVAGIGAIVRPPRFDSDVVCRALDAGAAGILAPRVGSATDAKTTVENIKFAPEGRRGLGGVRANRYGTQPLAEFVRESNDRTVVAVQIETPGALDEVGAIAALPGVDVLFVGPNDLTQALGIPGRVDDRRYLDALSRVAQAAADHGKAAGIMLGRREQIPALAETGYRFFTTSDRTLMLESARAWRSAL
ncbi:MAG TPA: aldolase/citrate lyase family protein [Thermoanaerobaculia bacterium]|nr:aldolase/citrate lyase family protein [Thermoanaerobaculia bacterium]